MPENTHSILDAGSTSGPSSGPRTWADGFGRWYAAVPTGDREAEVRVATEAIRRELLERDECTEDYRPTLEEAPHWPSRPGRTVWREWIGDDVREAS